MIAVLGMTSCDLLNVNVDADVEGALDVYVDESMAKSTDYGWYDFSESASVSLEDATEYSDRISEMTVNEVLVRVDDVDPYDEITLREDTQFFITNSIDTVFWSQGTNWTISEGVEVVLEDIQGSYENAAAMIEDAVTNDESLSIGTYGYSSEEGVHFQLWMIIKTNVEASLL